MRQMSFGDDPCVCYRLLELGRLRCHEQVDAATLEALIAEIIDDGALRQPVVVDSQTLVILDGHHRVRALERLGCVHVPAYLVDYRDPRIIVDCWQPGRAPLTKDEVVRAGSHGRPYPPKTSRHRFGPLALHAKPVPLAQLGMGAPAQGETSGSAKLNLF